jgi:hypothetical protein
LQKDDIIPYEKKSSLNSPSQDESLCSLHDINFRTRTLHDIKSGNFDTSRATGNVFNNLPSTLSTLSSPYILSPGFTHRLVSAALLCKSPSRRGLLGTRAPRLIIIGIEVALPRDGFSIVTNALPFHQSPFTRLDTGPNMLTPYVSGDTHRSIGAGEDAPVGIQLATPSNIVGEPDAMSEVDLTGLETGGNGAGEEAGGQNEEGGRGLVEHCE